LKRNFTIYFWNYRALCLYAKNGFAEVSKNTDKHIDLQIILLDHQNNYGELKLVVKKCPNFILALFMMFEFST